MKPSKIASFLLLVAGIAQPARAGVLDTPVPLLSGDKARIAFILTGVVNTPEVATTVHCTGTDRTGGKRIRVAVEFFNADGDRLNDVAVNGQTRLYPGRTVTISSSRTAAYTESFLDIGEVTLGSARVLATSGKLVCNAQVLDSQNDPPLSSTRLPLFVKGKQKGQ